MCDGAVKFVPDTTDLTIIRAIATRAQGEGEMLPQ